MSNNCPICGLLADTGRSGDRKQIDCPRCGHYEVSGTAIGMVKDRASDRRIRARLSHAVRRRATDDYWPLITSYNLDALAAEPLPTPQEQILNLLRWIADHAEDDRFHSIEIVDDRVTGIIGAVDDDGANAIIRQAEEDGLIDFTPDDYYNLTVRGWEIIEHNIKEAGKIVNTTGERIFIGHGRSRVWRDLKDYLSDRLGLEWEEFNRESAAGISTQERLQSMLDNAAFAFIVMTAEDETADGILHPRMNVVHEAGLFQGKLGFRKAIILLEEGCQEFSNVIGLGQVRFPPGDLRPVLDEIRQVLEREGIV